MRKATTNIASAIAFVDGRIMTMDPENAGAEVLVISGGRIAGVGSKTILQSYPDAEIIDLGGRTLLPGFIDAHNHLSFGCFMPEWANLRGLTTKEAILEAVHRHASDHPGQGWLIGYYWVDAGTGGPALSRQDLDGLGIDRPILLIQHSFHKSLANTRALELAGIDRLNPDPRCGKIDRDADGVPTGILWENAQVPVFRLALEHSTGDYAGRIEERAGELLAFGITAVHDPGVTPAAEAAYRLLHAERRLPVSVLMMPHGETLVDNGISGRLDGPVTGTGDEMLRIGPVKLFADGGVSGTISLGGRIQGQDYTLGLPRTDFKNTLIEATRRGFRVCVHAIGNLAVEEALVAFEDAARIAPPGLELRPRLEHMFLLSDAQIKRLASMGGCSAVQPCLLVTAQALKQVSFEGMKWFALRDLLEGGVVLAGSSDDPGGYFDGRDPIRSSIMGATMNIGTGMVLFPEQTMSLEQWLWIYTAGSAYAGGQEQERGMLKKGLVADLVILDGDLDPANPPVVAETWKNGMKVYSRQAKQDLIA